MTSAHGDLLVAGIGRADRRDDAFGLVVAAALRDERLRGVDVVALAAPMSLLEAWAGYRRVVVVDAVLSGRRPGGSVTVEEVGAGPMAARMGSGGTHALGLPDVVELGRVLGSLPEQLIVVGVEAVDLGFGEGLSPRVAAAVVRATSAVASIVVGHSANKPLGETPSPLIAPRAGRRR